ncbi:uncharacterized protein LOC108153421 [Drosophila miranda]|uniref:uncharacterized protein LOC108153421 n=1 Tax=Drosophila miranda TaxID=7229 RepID=UPI0007E81818|nr:uncharacterized protein LOC108153421 [Drosophila miranda]
MPGDRVTEYRASSAPGDCQSRSCRLSSVAYYPNTSDDAYEEAPLEAAAIATETTVHAGHQLSDQSNARRMSSESAPSSKWPSSTLSPCIWTCPAVKDYFRMPGEKVDRVMEIFSQRYCVCNTRYSIFVQAFAMMMARYGSADPV